LRRPRAPLFLARAVYRKRRLRDAARLLPLLGVFLLVLPALWTKPASGGADWVYVFVVWAGLIGLAFALAPGLAEPKSGQPDEDEDLR
jgi:peptidoglycan/LPS O-acetylase OafA/YrhL